jgi:hypothetical protein
MYIINDFVFGYDLNEDLELKQMIEDIDLEFSKSIGDLFFEISSPYHGGCMSLDCPKLFGTIIASDDDNEINYVTEIRNAKEEDYLDSFKEFVETFKKEAFNAYSEKDKVNYFKEYEEYTNTLKEIIKRLDNLEPKFYILESSS